MANLDDLNIDQFDSLSESDALRLISEVRTRRKVVAEIKVAKTKVKNGKLDKLIDKLTDEQLMELMEKLANR